MSGELRDRIARALFLHKYPNSDAWDMPGDFGKQGWWDQAQAVIDALGLTERYRPLWSPNTLRELCEGSAYGAAKTRVEYDEIHSWEFGEPYPPHGTARCVIGEWQEVPT